MTFDIERSEIIFLPTPSHGGRQQRPQRTCQSRRDFYPRPHMEGDGKKPSEYDNVLISTHALTWRATKVEKALSSLFWISTHALTWRATMWRATSSCSTSDFYPRPHMEGD